MHVTFEVSKSGNFSRVIKTRFGTLVETTRDTLKMVKLMVSHTETWSELSIITAETWWSWKCEEKGYIRGSFNEDLYRKIRVIRNQQGY